MALFKKLTGALGDAVSDGIGKGISNGIGKGLQNAVGKAVESAVRPAADKLAGQAAENLNQTAQTLAESNEALKAATNDLSREASSAGYTAPASQGSGAADLGTALGSWASAMEGFAGSVAMNMKECPVCGETVTAEHKFCPKCGATLPEKTIGAGYLCPKCGKQNVPGTAFCTECGTILPAEEEERSKQLALWDEYLPQYPKWNLGGKLELDTDMSVNGNPAVGVQVGGVGIAQLQRYVELLKADGFLPAYDGDSDFYYKMVDGVCRAFDKTDANQGDFLSFTFFVGVFDKRAAEKEKAEAARKAALEKADAAKAAAKDTAKAAAGAAKGLFKKFF